MHIGLFGAGRIGTVHAESIAAHPNAELAWVYDPVTEAAQRVATANGGRATSSIDDAFSGVDAIIIASPTATHVDLIIQAVEAGLPVLCEKPIDLDLARVDDCWAHIKDASPVVMIGFNRRFDPSFREIHDRIVAGEIGRLEQVTIISRDPQAPPPNYVAGSGGLFRDMTIHDLDMARFLLGDIVEVHAVGSNLIDPGIAEAGDIDGAVIVLRAASGALATIANSRRCAFGYDQRVEAFGSAGMLQAANHLPTSVRLSSSEQTESAAPYLTFFRERYAAAYTAELSHFIDCVGSGTSPSPGFTDGREALALADAANESMRTEAVVRIHHAG